MGIFHCYVCLPEGTSLDGIMKPYGFLDVNHPHYLFVSVKQQLPGNSANVTFFGDGEFT